MAIKQEPVDDAELYQIADQDVEMLDVKGEMKLEGPRKAPADWQLRRGGGAMIHHPLKKKTENLFSIDTDAAEDRASPVAGETESPITSPPLDLLLVNAIEAHIREKNYAMKLEKGRLVFLKTDAHISEVPALETPDTPDGFLPKLDTIPPPPPRGSLEKPFNHHFRISRDDPEHQRWRTALGDRFVKEVFQLLIPIPESKIFRIADFPKGYALGCHYHYGKLKNPPPDSPEYKIRKDFYLYGSQIDRGQRNDGRQVQFRSPEEFKQHLLWVISPSGDRKCKYCDEERYERKKLEARLKANSGPVSAPGRSPVKVEP